MMLIFSKPAIAIHDERDMFWHLALFEHFNCHFLEPGELQHVMMCYYTNEIKNTFIISMLNQFCREESYSSGIQTNAYSQKYYKSLNSFRELEKQPDFMDTYAKFNKQNLLKEQLQNIVEQVTEQIIESINKKVHETFYREINLLITQVLSIRQQMTIFSRDQFKHREQLKSQVSIQQWKLKQQIKKVHKIVEFLRKQNRNLSMPTFSRHFTPRIQEREQQRSSISNYSQLQHIQIRREIQSLFEKLEELKQETTKEQHRLSNRIQQTKQKNLSAFLSLSSQIQQISENMALQDMIQKDVKQLFDTVQKIKEILFDSQRQVNQLKEDFIRYQDSGIFYLSNRQ